MAASAEATAIEFDQESDEKSIVSKLNDSVSSEENLSIISSIHSDEAEPSYIIVQKQMRDLILSQNFAVEELLKSNVSCKIGKKMIKGFLVIS